MASVCLLVLCGIPGAGKSTWAKRFCSYVHERESQTSFNKQRSDGLNENGKGDKEGAGEGVGQGKRQETYRVIHIAYDDLIPEELETELIHDAQNHSKETKGVRWKTYRRAIVRCVDDLVAELSSLSSLPGHMTCDSQAASDEKIKSPVDNGDVTDNARLNFRNEESQQKCPVTDDPSVREVTNLLSQGQLTEDRSSENYSASLSLIANCSSSGCYAGLTEGPVGSTGNHMGELERLKLDHYAEKISDLDSMEAVPGLLRTIFDDVVRRQIKGRSNSTGLWVLVIDDNMYYSSMRYEFYQLARKYASGFAQVFFPVELTTALRRNEARKRQVDEFVIRDMLNRLECPCVDISWQQHTATWISENWDKSCFENVLQLVDEAMSHPVMPVPEDKEEANESRSICMASLLHQADVALRKILGEHITTTKEVIKSKTERTRMAASSNLIRKQILDDLRSRTLTIPDGMVLETSTDEENPFHLYLKSIFHQRLITCCSKSETKC